MTAGTVGAVSRTDLPGRLGDPSRSLKDDPRADPRLVAALAVFGLDGPGEPATVSVSSTLAEMRQWCDESEVGFEAMFAALMEGLPAIAGVTRETVTIPGQGGHEISLYVHKPESPAGALPCVYHVHGGGMVLLEAAGPCYQRWRDELAATGLVVVGVEYRNGAGKLGPHPFPAGLQDCADGLRWVAGHLGDLGASHVVVSGESGGANLSLALAHKAKREGWLDVIRGVYAQCPYIAGGDWAELPARLPSLRENAGYFISPDTFPVMAEVYDPGGANAADPTCWPARATDADLEGLPPHVISVNELDPLRDEGIEYYRRLRDAGVSAVGRVVLGTCHATDVFFAAAIPDVHAASLRDVSGFAHSLS
jgi:acetyl esterase/lipase